LQEVKTFLLENQINEIFIKTKKKQLELGTATKTKTKKQQKTTPKPQKIKQRLFIQEFYRILINLSLFFG
jgi:hypothetical protein